MAVNPLTTTTTIGVVTRYAISIGGAIIAALVLVGWVDQETADQLTETLPELIGALGAVVALAVPIYAAITKSNSDKASEVANVVDAEVPADAPVVIKTPVGAADIVVNPKT
jgi:uncharacterized membrane protein